MHLLTTTNCHTILQFYFLYHFKSGFPWLSCFWLWPVWSWSSCWSWDRPKDRFRYVYIYIYNYIDQKMCTVYPYTYTEIYIGAFAGQSAFRVMFNLMQFCEPELCSRLKSIKSFYFFKEKRSASRAWYGGARFHFTEVACWSIPSHRRDAHLRFSRIGMSSEKFNR